MKSMKVRIQNEKEIVQRTVAVPGEGIAQFLAFDLHVESDGHQQFQLVRVLVHHRRVRVVKAATQILPCSSREKTKVWTLSRMIPYQ